MYGYHVSALLHCISVLYKRYVFLLHYITVLGWGGGVALLFLEELAYRIIFFIILSLESGAGPFLYQNF